jgi:hypothetical protein
MKLLLWIWQLPQHLLGLLFLAYWKIVGTVLKEKFETATIYLVDKKNGTKFAGVSLGSTIFINKNRSLNPYIRPHEYGHSLQSQMLGPLYLLIVGVPSVTMALWSTIWYNMEMKKALRTVNPNEKNISWTEASIAKPIINKIHRWYYGTLQEAWAEKLGKVDREY